MPRGAAVLEAEEAIRPQPGPQEAFLACTADVAFYGGAAGGGKSVGLVLEPLHFATTVKGFTAVIFRRVRPDITNPGGLWDEACGIYPRTGARSNESDLSWTWPNGSWMRFSHLQRDKDVSGWMGSQVCMIGFDELPHFTERQFLYMLSRNRSGCGVKPYVRATMNPDPDTWVKEWIAWWLDADGNPIRARSGKVRWFARNKGKIEWADRREDLERLGLKPKSFTFIQADVHDNKILLERNPEYLANLEALLPHERAALLLGNWDARPVAGNFFRREWVGALVDRAPERFDEECRYWDRAATEKSQTNPSPDATVGVHMRRVGSTFYVCDVVSRHATPGDVERAIVACAEQQPRCTTVLEQDPGSSGIADVDHLITALNRWRVEAVRVSTNKQARARPFASQAQAGNVKVVRGAWNSAWMGELEGFPDADHDDHMDATSGAYSFLAANQDSIRRGTM